MIDDAAGASQQFSDDDLQTVLDGRRIRLYGYMRTDADGLLWRSEYGNLDDDTQIRDGNNADVSASGTFDRDDGSMLYVARPSYTPKIVGYAYDLHAAAADLWTVKMSKTGRWSGQFAQNVQGLVRYHLSRSWTRVSWTERI